MSFILSSTHDSGSKKFEISGDSTWMDLTDEFHHFLLGCGFSVSRQDISDYLNERVPQDVEQTDGISEFPKNT